MAVFLAIMFTQVGFLGHDAGHRQISASRSASHVLGILLGDFCIGLSFGWWVSKHNRHHSHPNTEGADPDVAMKALAFTAGQARCRPWSGQDGLPLPGVPVLPDAARLRRSASTLRASAP